eukprot:Blabericola_migrator_1__3829@NODE_2153_length_3197_cov_221_557827_g176_i1_p2_GENE_NODE_2153_length_3197_cov_221_557827_g176_i1NODE_2153_length_3197_cov_221_557827_g176_i1_p2_ORF_typecomplete_len324_score57_97DnaJ/PF00226_31/6_8e13_NODE_2153_length_3197_cov_221_557827_g176_i121763147
MLTAILTLLSVRIVAQSIVGDAFSNYTKYTFRQRLERVVKMTLFLSAYVLYECVKDVGRLKGSGTHNPYFVLGVGRTASKREIMTQSRSLAKQFHPDRNPSPDAVVKFRLIRESAKALLNDNWRVAYDRFGDTLKQEYLEGAMAHPNALLTLFLWDSIRQTTTALMHLALFHFEDISRGRFGTLVNYLVVIGGVQAAILSMRFSVLTSDGDLISSIIGKRTFQFGIIEEIPFVKNLTMFQRTQLLAVVIPFAMTTMRQAGHYWSLIMEEFQAKQSGHFWVPSTLFPSDLPTLLKHIGIINKQVIALHPLSHTPPLHISAAARS